jgi:hypothetical protein
LGQSWSAFTAPCSGDGFPDAGRFSYIDDFCHGHAGRPSFASALFPIVDAHANKMHPKSVKLSLFVIFLFLSRYLGEK